jgi:hypothetical protein
LNLLLHYYNYFYLLSYILELKTLELNSSFAGFGHRLLVF